jgi:hypothetical protein
MKFTEKDIQDMARLERMVEREAKAIFNSPCARKNRTYEEIYAAVKQGKIAELYLIENYGYEEAGKQWHDLIDSDGDYTEVKAYAVYTTDAPSVIRDLNRLRNENWNVSKWYMLFQCIGGEYELLEKIQIR